MSEQEKPEKPSMPRKVWNLTQAITRYATSGFKTVPNDKFAKRMIECNNCEFLDAENSACGVCGCKIEIKGQWSTEVCPKGKWDV